MNVQVPKIVDEQSGAVTRKLQKAHETFDIENAKIAKREQKVRASVGAAEGGAGESHAFVACLSRSPTDHAPISRRSIVATPIRDRGGEEG